MTVWLPYTRGGSGTDVFTDRLALILREHGYDVVQDAFPHHIQYTPWVLRAVPPPQGTRVIVANSWNAFAFRRPNIALVAIQHLCILDPAFLPYRSKPQAIFHESLVRRFERASFRQADKIVAVSHYAAQATQRAFPGIQHPEVIYNGIDTEFFSPETDDARATSSAFRLLFVGNLTRRKGADLLAPIMRNLGSSFVLRYTGGLRTGHNVIASANMTPLGQLSQTAMLSAYRESDALLYPTRLEGFGYAAAEAMACGIPVIATDGSSLPELVSPGSTGLLCPIDDVRAFADAARQLSDNASLRGRMAANARAQAVSRFSLAAMGEAYSKMLATLT
jgi:alpha-maltose-1-phosphate synthase